jgi:hypothetical protein
MKDHLYERLYEIRNVADEHIEEYQELFEKMYNERDDTTFRKFCTVLIDESPSGNTSVIDAMWREYVEHFHENVTHYITDLLENADAFIPDARRHLRYSLLRILNGKIYEQEFLRVANKMYNEGNRNYDIVKSSLLDFMNYDFGNEDIVLLKKILVEYWKKCPKEGFALSFFSKGITVFIN